MMRLDPVFQTVGVTGGDEKDRQKGSPRPWHTSRGLNSREGESLVLELGSEAWFSRC